MSSPAQHEAEHAAGRAALFAHGSESTNLRDRFKTIVSVTLSDAETVVVTVQAGDGKFYEVEGPLKGYPTDDLIASLMLLNASN